MASDFTYTGAVDTDLAKVRLIIGDISKEKPRLSDSEINFFLENEGSIRRATVRCAESIAAIFASKVDQSIGKIRISFSKQFEHFTELAKRLANNANQAALAGAFSGGISKADKLIDEQNEDSTKPFFARDQFDTPGVTTVPRENNG